MCPNNSISCAAKEKVQRVILCASRAIFSNANQKGLKTFFKVGKYFLGKVYPKAVKFAVAESIGQLLVL